MTECCRLSARLSVKVQDERYTNKRGTENIGAGGDDGSRVSGGYPLSDSHTHPLTTDPATPQMYFQGNVFDNRPAFFKLVFIMKL